MSKNKVIVSRGKRKYVCQDCGKVMFCYPSKMQSRTRRTYCTRCGSTFFELSHGSIGRDEQKKMSTMKIMYSDSAHVRHA